MASEINPSLTPTKSLVNFRFWCQKVLPLVYDDSLSYYEVLGKMVVQLNDVIDNVNADTENVLTLKDAFLTLQTYVNEFFDDIDQLASYAERAETAQTAANQSAINAASSASNASASSLAAMDAKDAAVAARQAAETSANTASEASTNANTKANEAAQSAITAQTAQASASQSATLAATDRSVAQTAANTAASKATEASASATNAETSATNANASAESAEQSKDDAEALVANVQENLDNIQQNTQDISNLKESVNDITVTTPASKNLLDYTKTLANKYLNPNGRLDDLNGRYVTDYIPVEAGKYVFGAYIGSSSGAYTRLSYATICLYDKDMNVVTGGNYNQPSFLVPDGVAYVRMTFGNRAFATNYGMVEQTDDGELTDFVFYIGEEGKKLSDDIIVPQKKLGYMQSKGNLSDGQSLTLPYHNVKNNNVLTFVANITSFDKLKIGKEDDSYLIIDNTNVTIYNPQGTFALAHGLTIQDDIQVVIENTTETVASLIRIVSSGVKYEVSGRYVFLMDSSSAYAISDGSTLTDCIFTWTSRNINTPIWLFGDSYFSWYSERWTYYLAQDGFTSSCMLNGFAGEDSIRAYNALTNLLNLRIPQYIVWCLGMNNGDSQTAVSAEWVRVYNTLVALQEKYGFELILATIPNTSTVNNRFKNDIIRNSGYRYIDFAKAVDPDDDGVWFEGTELNSHPTQKGAQILYHEVLADFPEITSI